MRQIGQTLRQRRNRQPTNQQVIFLETNQRLFLQHASTSVSATTPRTHNYVFFPRNCWDSLIFSIPFYYPLSSDLIQRCSFQSNGGSEPFFCKSLHGLSRQRSPYIIIHESSKEPQYTEFIQIYHIPSQTLVCRGSVHGENDIYCSHQGRVSLHHYRPIYIRLKEFNDEALRELFDFLETTDR